MPDYLGEDQRKTNQKDDKDDDKPIKGNLSFPLFNIRWCYYSSTGRSRNCTLEILCKFISESKEIY